MDKTSGTCNNNSEFRIPNSALNKYLRKNPAPELPAEKFREAVVIPAYDEIEELPATVESIRNANFTGAVIVVVNYPAGSDSTSSKALFEMLQGEPDLLPVWAPELTGGVGKARKLGMDAFIASRTMENLESSIIYSLDADSPVDPEYFKIVSAQFPKEQWVTVNFRHRYTPETRDAIIRYEKYLRRYADKLRQCKSPYGFITIGSAFAVRADSYIRAGGMKVRTAGEDFYFLQALAKLAPGKHLSEQLVFPSARPSCRVAFGTGPAVRKLIAGDGLPEIPDYAFDELSKVFTVIESSPPEKWANILPEPGAEFFRKEGFEKVWCKILQNTPKDPVSIRNAFDRWFDGLKTLRFLHFITNSECGIRNSELCYTF